MDIIFRPMRLILTPNSPYARVVRLIAFDAGVALTLNYLPTRDAADEILRYTPTGKVPTLVLDDGTTLSDTRVICEHIQVGEPWAVSGVAGRWTDALHG